MLLRGLFYEGWDPTGKPTKERHEAAFLAHIAKELPRGGRRARWSRASPPCLMSFPSMWIARAPVKLAGMFPKELRKFWPAFIQRAAREPQQGAAW